MLGSLVAVVVLWGLGGGISPAVALDVPPSVTAGTRLPAYPMPTASSPGFASGPDYLLVSNPYVDDYTPGTYTIRRVADGSSVRTIPSDPTPRVSGSSLLMNLPGKTLTYEVRDIATDAVTWTVSAPESQRHVETQATWMLTQSASDNTFLLQRAGRSSLTITGIDGFNAHVVASDARTILLVGGLSPWLIDVESGRATRLGTFRGHTVTGFLTPTRVYWTEENLAIVHWSDRQGRSAADVTVTGLPAHNVTWFGLGDEAAYSVTGASADDLTVFPVETATGTAGPALAEHVVFVEEQGGGTLRMITPTGPYGQIKQTKAVGDPLTVLYDLPLRPRRAAGAALVGNRAWTGFGGPDADQGLAASIGLRDGQPWSDDLVPGQPTEGGFVTAAGDVLVTKIHLGGVRWDSAGYVVSWPGGRRQLPGTYGDPALSRGGLTVSYVGLDGGVKLEDARTGRLLRTFAQGEPWSVDRDVLWVGPDRYGRITATNVLTEAPLRTVQTSRNDCGSALLTVVERFALVQCGIEASVLDLDGVMRDRPFAGSFHDGILGKGFIGRLVVRDVDQAEPYIVLAVTDLGPGGQTKEYGPVHGRSSPPAPVAVADDTGLPRMAFLDAGYQLSTVDITGLTTAPTSDTSALPGSLSDRYQVVSPARAVDTRSGLGLPTGRPTGVVKAGTWLTVPLTGRLGLPMTGVDAVVLNVTAVTPAAAGYLSLGTDPTGRPSTSNLNYRAGLSVANQVVAPVAIDGSVSVYSSASSHVLIDVAGYLPRGNNYVSTDSTRVYDSRSRLRIPAGGRLDIPVTGRGGVPGDGVETVGLNVTALAPAGSGYLIVWPTGANRPGASTLNYARSQTVAGYSLMKVGTGGRVSIYASAETDVLVDVGGWLPPGSDLNTRTPVRLLDTRAAGIAARPSAGSTTVVQVTGRAGVPVFGVKAVVVNLTAVRAAGSGYVTVFPGSGALPNISTLNVAAGQTVANSAIVPVDAQGKVRIFTSTSSDLILDVQGWVLSPP